MNNKVCPVEKAGGLDNAARRLLQNPRKILKPFLREGMTVMDMGCGPGFFSVEMARMLGRSGKVIAVDLQKGMLDLVRQKIRGTELEQRIELHQCQSGSTGVTRKVDFILAFYVVHEVPDQAMLFNEFRSILNPGGIILIVEPKMHVGKKPFRTMTGMLTHAGFEITGSPKVFLGRSVVLRKKEEIAFG